MKYVRFQIGGGIINTGILYGNHIRRVEGSLFGPFRMTFEEYDLKNPYYAASVSRENRGDWSELPFFSGFHETGTSQPAEDIS